jgi:hypothetical protein
VDDAVRVRVGVGVGVGDGPPVGVQGTAELANVGFGSATQGMSGRGSRSVCASAFPASDSNASPDTASACRVRRMHAMATPPRKTNRKKRLRPL